MPTVMMRVSTAVLVGLLLLTGPGVAAQGERAEFRFETPGRLVLMILQTLEDNRANETRRQIDDAGNQDGVVSQAEVDSAESNFLNVTRQLANNTGAANDFTVDGVGRSRTEFTALQIHNAVGPVKSDVAINVELHVRMEFPVTAAAEHTVRVRQNASSSDEMDSATLFAPQGYVIASATGLPLGAMIAKDKRSIAYAGPVRPQGDEMTIVFAQGTAAGVDRPAMIWLFVAVFAVVAVVGVVLVMRARRHP